MMESKRHISLTLAIVLALFTVSCQKGKNNQSSSSDQQEVVMNIDQLKEQADDLIDTEVAIEGLCTHICAHGGGKIFLMGDDESNTIRVEAGESIGSFAQETVGSMVKVNGILKETRIDEAYLTNWEAQMTAQTAEKHGDSNSGGCSADMKANEEQAANDLKERIENFRSRIAERTEKEGKPYVSLYHIEANSYEIIK